MRLIQFWMWKKCMCWCLSIIELENARWNNEILILRHKFNFFVNRWLSLCPVWPSYSQWPSEQISFITTMRLTILQLSCRLFWQRITSPTSVSSIQPRFGSLQLLAFPKAKIVVERGKVCECDGHTVHKLSQRRLTADWLDPWESDYWQTHGRVSSDWLPSYIKTTPPVLEIFKMTGYFPDSPLIQ